MIAAPTVRVGFKDASGFWNTIWISLRVARGRDLVERGRDLPCSVIEPPVAGVRPMMARATVVLPLPLSPTTPRVWPTQTSRSMPSTARMRRAWRPRMSPRAALKWTSTAWAPTRASVRPHWASARRTASVAARRYSAGAGTLCQRRQAERWAAATSASGGRRVVQASSTKVQRGAKMQPLGSSSTRGMAPGMVTRERFCGVGSKRGTQPRRSSV